MADTALLLASLCPSIHLAPPWPLLPGQHFASGGADKTVIIWNHKLEGELKYSHSDTVLALCFSPISQQLLSCAISDFGELRAVR